MNYSGEERRLPHRSPGDVTRSTPGIIQLYGDRPAINSFDLFSLRGSRFHHLRNVISQWVQPPSVMFWGSSPGKLERRFVVGICIEIMESEIGSTCLG